MTRTYLESLYIEMLNLLKKILDVSKLEIFKVKSIRFEITTIESIEILRNLEIPKVLQAGSSKNLKKSYIIIVNTNFRYYQILWHLDTLKFQQGFL